MAIVIWNNTETTVDRCQNYHETLTSTEDEVTDQLGNG